MIDPYMAVALQTTIRHVTTRDEVDKNLTHIGNMIDLVMHICALELPVRLIALSEGVIQGFADEILHMSPAGYAKTMAAEIPGKETEFLGNKAKQHDVYIIAQLKVRLAEFPDRFFNAVFMVDPKGDVIYTHYKNVVLFVEHSTTPHDVYDKWVQLHGNGLDAFFPVARTEIGNIAGTVGVEGAFPETFRAFALNGAEILYRGALPEPWVGRQIYEVQNRARALDNCCYVLAPNGGSLIMPGAPGEMPTTVGGALGGRSGIYAYNGDVLAESSIVDDAYVSGEINIDALRYYRQNAKFQNWLPYLRSEIYRSAYDAPVWPANDQPLDDKAAEQVLKETIASLQSRGAFAKR